MFSNSEKEISAKDELLNINDEVESARENYDINLLQQYNKNSHSSSIRQQKTNKNQDVSKQNSIMTLNNTLTIGQERGMIIEKQIKKENHSQFPNESNVSKKIGNGSNSKTVDNQRRKIIKPEALNFIKSTNREFKLSTSCTRGSIKPSISLQESFVNEKEEQNPYIDNTTAFLKYTQNQQSNQIQKNELTKNNDNDEKEISVCLSQVYSKREKVAQENKNQIKKQIRGDRKSQLVELQININYQNGYIDKSNNNSTNLGVKFSPNNLTSNKCSSVKNSQRRLNLEAYSSKKIEDKEKENDVRKIQIISGKKQSLDGTILFPSVNQHMQKNQQYLCSSMIQQSDQKENNPFIFNNENQLNNYHFSSSQILNHDGFRRNDSFQQSRERWIDKLESDYFNLLSKNIKGQRGYTVETQRNQKKKTNNNSEMEIQIQNTFINQSLKESFIDSKNTNCQDLIMNDNSSKCQSNSSKIIENDNKKQQAQSLDPTHHNKSRDISLRNQVNNKSKEPTPLRNNKKVTQLEQRRKSIQILKKFDPNVVSIQMIKNEFNQIPETVQKYFESKQTKIQKQLQQPNAQNIYKSPRNQDHILNMQEIDIEQDDSSMIFQNQEIINRIINSNDQYSNLSQLHVAQDSKNIQDGLIQSPRLSPSRESKFTNNSAPFKDPIDSTLPYQQGSLFYNYLEYKQFKSKLEYEKEQRRREKLKKAKLRNKSPLQSMAQQEQFSGNLEKYKDVSFIPQVQNNNGVEAQMSSIINDKQDIYSQSQQDQSPQKHTSQQKKKSISINPNFFHLNNGFIPQFRLPQSSNNNQVEKKRIKLNQFSTDNKITSNQEIHSTSSNNNSQQSNTNKLPQIQKKYLF